MKPLQVLIPCPSETGRRPKETTWSTTRSASWTAAATTSPPGCSSTLYRSSSNTTRVRARAPDSASPCTFISVECHPGRDFLAPWVLRLRLKSVIPLHFPSLSRGFHRVKSHLSSFILQQRWRWSRNSSSSDQMSRAQLWLGPLSVSACSWSVLTPSV